MKILIGLFILYINIIKAEETEQFLKDQIKEKDTSIHLLQTLLSAPKPKDLGVKQEDATQEIAPQVINEPQPIETAVYSGKEQTDTELKSRKKGLLGRVISAVFDG